VNKLENKKTTVLKEELIVPPTTSPGFHGKYPRSFPVAVAKR
jgi:hypothetical protein